MRDRAGFFTHNVLPRIGGSDNPLFPETGWQGYVDRINIIRIDDVIVASNRSGGTSKGTSDWHSSMKACAFAESLLATAVTTPFPEFLIASQFLHAA